MLLPAEVDLLEEFFERLVSVLPHPLGRLPRLERLPEKRERRLQGQRFVSSLPQSSTASRRATAAAPADSVAVVKGPETFSISSAIVVVTVDSSLARRPPSNATTPRARRPRAFCRTARRVPGVVRHGLIIPCLEVGEGSDPFGVMSLAVRD